MSEKNGFQTLLTDGVLLAAASALGYMASYFFEYGFFSFFNLPTEFISPNLATVLAVAASFIGLFGSTFNLVGFAGPLLHAALDPKRSSYRLIWLFLFLCVVSIIFLRYAYGWGWRGTMVAAGIAIGVLLFLTLPVLIFDRKKPIRERFEEQAELNARDPFHISSIFEIWWTPRTVALAIVPLLILGAAYLLGNGEAAKKARYLTLVNASDTVVLRAYGDLLITAKFSRVERVVSDELVLLWISEKKEIAFRNEEVGPLTVAKKRESTKPAPNSPAHSNFPAAQSVLPPAIPASSAHLVRP